MAVAVLAAGSCNGWVAALRVTCSFAPLEGGVPPFTGANADRVGDR